VDDDTEKGKCRGVGELGRKREMEVLYGLRERD
jgi:hypothetical protein